MKIKKYLLILSLSLLLNDSLIGQNFTIARIHYSGGGDWYADPSSLPNLRHGDGVSAPTVAGQQAAEANVSTRTIERARQIQREAPKLAAKVEKGELTQRQALKQKIGRAHV